VVFNVELGNILVPEPLQKNPIILSNLKIEQIEAPILIQLNQAVNCLTNSFIMQRNSALALI
jgi:hypothetical protein